MKTGLSLRVRLWRSASSALATYASGSEWLDLQRGFRLLDSDLEAFVARLRDVDATLLRASKAPMLMHHHVCPGSCNFQLALLIRVDVRLSIVKGVLLGRYQTTSRTLVNIPYWERNLPVTCRLD